MPLHDGWRLVRREGDRSSRGRSQVRHRALFVLGMLALAIGMVGPVTGAAASGQRPVLNRHPGQVVTSATARFGPRVPDTATAPGVGASWAGVTDFSLSPPDPNGAIGPNSYVELI